MQSIDNERILKISFWQMLRRLPAVLIASAIVMLLNMLFIGMVIGSMAMVSSSLGSYVVYLCDVPSMAQIGAGVATLLLVLSIMLFACTFIIYGIFCHIFDNIAQERPILTTDDVSRSLHVAFPLCVAQLIYGLGVFLSSLAFVIPGIVLAMGWALYPFVLINEPVGPWQALVRSYNMMYGHRMQLFVLELIPLAILAIRAVLPIGGSLFITLAAGIWQLMLPLCMAHYYHIISSKHTKREHTDVSYNN